VELERYDAIVLAPHVMHHPSRLLQNRGITLRFLSFISWTPHIFLGYVRGTYTCTYSAGYLFVLPPHQPVSQSMLTPHPVPRSNTHYKSIINPMTCAENSEYGMVDMESILQSQLISTTITPKTTQHCPYNLLRASRPDVVNFCHNLCVGHNRHQRMR
jgi:hypothetical protein